jgi:hypothetical protein
MIRNTGKRSLIGGTRIVFISVQQIFETEKKARAKESWKQPAINNEK